jgi:voltage-gated potassium channel
LIRLLLESNRAANRIGWIARRNGVHVALIVAIGLAAVGGSLVWELEHTVNRSFPTIGDAVWWAFSTMTTVGSGGEPITWGGRLVAGVLMVIGVACFGLITATVTTLFLERVGGRATTVDLLVVLRDVQLRLDRLEKGFSSAMDPNHGGMGAILDHTTDDHMARS